MATHDPASSPDSEVLNLRESGWTWFRRAKVVAIVGLVWAIALGYFAGDNFRRFFFAYLTAYFYFLTLALGGLFFVLIQHLTKAGWSVNVRRIAEWFAASMPLMAVLSAPIIISIATGYGGLYLWSQADNRAAFPHFKREYLNPAFVLVRMLFYFAVWSGLGVWYWKQSVKQDQSGDIELTRKMQFWAGPAMILFGLTLTFAAFDLLMSLDPGWFSTIFGVYIFAGCVIAIHATIVLVALFLQRGGFLRQSITVEHYHDLGKFLFAFVFFWGYVAFSQFMLQWYGNIPEETEWYRHRGATTAIGAANGWSVVILLILFCHVLIPFAGLMSRHVKRNTKTLAFWAVWMLAFHWLDLFWIVQPEYGRNFEIGFIDLAVLLGIGGVFAMVIIRKASHDALRPIRDPRLTDALAYENA